MKDVFDKEIADFINGYALPKLIIGFGLWQIAVNQFERSHGLAAIILGTFAICSMMEAIRLFRQWRRMRG